MGQSNPLANKSANIVRDMARLNTALDISSNLRPPKVTGKKIEGHFQYSEISRWSILVAQGTISFLKEKEVVRPVIVMQFSHSKEKENAKDESQGRSSMSTHMLLNTDSVHYGTSLSCTPRRP